MARKGDRMKTILAMVALALANALAGAIDSRTATVPCAYTNEAGEVLLYRLAAPKSDGGPAPLVLFLHGSGGSFDIYDFGPYYSFYLWLAYNFKTLYLPSQRHGDGLSTILYDTQGNMLCKHSWMARKYKVDAAQTQRINALIDEVYALRGRRRPQITRSERMRFAVELAAGYVKKAFIRIVRWPGKLRRAIRHKKEKRP